MLVTVVTLPYYTQTQICLDHRLGTFYKTTLLLAFSASLVASPMYNIRYYYMDIEQGLRDLYYDPKTGYQSAERLYQKAVEDGNGSQ